MGEFTDTERVAIKDIFAKIDTEAVGPTALSRYMYVYPWSKKYFRDLGTLSNADAVKSNPSVSAHGKVVMDVLARAAQNLDNTKAMHAELSGLQKLKVDPDYFRLLAHSITVEVATHLGKDFTPELNAAFQKFMDVTVSMQGKQNH
ncbi:hemoglobin subunit beta-2-like [Betta splendens]|uniref:Hemoglobin subunit beta-2-like n=1 Tax=Betta splendens TaxID=158456 RepID=A0A6P7NB07_BETSP|nr:hemoglobin subunit beta-2-like [Betta splendens]